MKSHASLNRAYRLVWNRILNTYVAVSEHTKSRGKSSATKRILLATFLSSLSFGSLNAMAGPAGGQITSGTGSISQTGNTTTINQTSQTLNANWQSFNVNTNETVNFVQPNSTALAVNRIFDTNGSKILGNINANGQVWLINPNGVFFGQGSQVNVGSLLATTLNPLNTDLNANSTQVFGNRGTGSIINQGTINTSNGGYVALIGNTVSNTGSIQANGGSVALGAGSQVSVTFADNQLLSLNVDQSTLNNLAENQGIIQANGGQVLLSAGAKDSLLASVVNNTGKIEAKTVQHKDGKIILSSNHGMVNTGELNVSGDTAGQIEINTKNLIDAGQYQADGITQGGRINIQATNHIEQTTAATLNANASNGKAGNISINAGSDAFLSSTLNANGNGATGQGGSIKVTAPDLSLAGANLNATGTQLGGQVNVGGGWQGKDASIANANTTKLIASHIDVSAKEAGNAGTAVIWSEQNTTFNSDIKATGGAVAGNGGMVEVSSHGTLNFGGTVDASATNGNKGTLLLDPKNIEIITGSTSGYSLLNLADPTPSANETFGGFSIVELKNNGVGIDRVVVVSLFDDNNATDAGAVRLYNSQTGALISTLSGNSASDFVGISGITALTNGNFVVNSYIWNNSSGAVTWGNGITGITGVVSSSNSLVGSTAGDFVGNQGVIALTNGNYVVNSGNWSNGSIAQLGAVTWGDGNSGTTGLVSANNSLVGSSASDVVGSSGVIALTNGNYVVSSSNWDNGSIQDAGAVTWGNGSTGITGVVSASNSLVGSTASDNVGLFGVTALTNGNYVVRSFAWDNSSIQDAGAVTLGNGNTGITGVVSSSNSLVGSQTNDSVGNGVVTALTNGNYVVSSPNWNNGSIQNAGAVTWGNGSTGITGVVSASNSLVGSSENDFVGNNGVIALTNGNYVVSSTRWDNDSFTDAGAVTWGNGSTGITGFVSASNSLVGSSANVFVSNNGVIALTNGNYVVNSSFWSNGSNPSAGAVTWGNGSTGITGFVSASNSLVGSSANDFVGSGGVTVLTNGNYVVGSYLWDNGSIGDAGAVTWCNGSTGIAGVISSSNSLVGSTASDNVGLSGITALTNGNYVVRSAGWDNGSITNAGAVTWGNGSTGISGVVSASNSLVGSTASDNVGSVGIFALTNGNYVVSSYIWDNGSIADAGAVTWGNGSTGISGVVSASNSLVGSSANEFVGNGGVTALTNGNYVVSSPNWDNGIIAQVGAVTWGNGSTGITGVVSASNSLVGSSENDFVGNNGIIALSDGRALVRSFRWDNGSIVDAGRVDIMGPGGLPSLGSNNYSDNPAANSQIQVGSITNILNAGTNVVLQANNDITLSTALTTNNPTGNGGALTLQAGRSVLLNANITTDNGDLTVIANDKASNGVVDANRDAGAANITMASGTSINAGSGNVVMELRDGAGLTNSTSGNITLNDVNANTIKAMNKGATANSGVIVNGTLTTTATTGTAIELAGQQFTNNKGANAFATANGSRWLVWSGNPANDVRGGLSYDFKQYNANYGTSTVLGSGNGLLYTVAPSVTASLVGTVSKTYDGNTDATLSNANYNVSGAIDGDSVTLNNPTTGSYTSAGTGTSNKNVGSGKTVTATGVAVDSASNGTATVYGYQVDNATVSADIGDITAKAITVAATANNKVYDATTTASLASLGSAGVIAGDTVNFTNTTANFDTKDVGTAKTVTVAGIGATGIDANNYTFNTTATTLANITPLALRSLTAVASAQNKVYDGTTTATATLSSIDILAGDNVTFTYGAANFDTKNVGTGKTVTVTGIGAGGSSVSNYTLQNTTATTTANITPKVLNLSGSRMYDGTNTINANVLSINGLVGTETLGLTGTGTVLDKNVGNNKTITPVNYALTNGTNGGLASNYTLVGGTKVANITPKVLTVTGALQAENKTYDGTTKAKIDDADKLKLSGLVGTETLGFKVTGANFADKNAGTNKTVTVNYGLSNGKNGGLASNYTVVNGTTTANIRKANLFYVAKPVSIKKPTLLSSGVPALTGTLQGFITGETQSNATTGPLSWNTNATRNSNVGSYYINGSGLTSQNYNLIQAPANSSAFKVTR